MLGLFRNAGRAVLGMEITGSSIRFVELSRSSSGYCLERWGIEPLPPQAGSEMSAGMPQSAPDVLPALFERECRYRSILLALPDAQLVSQEVSVPPGLSDEELNAYLRIDAAQYVPYSLDDAALDFCRLESPGTESQQVLLMICRRELIDSRTELLARAGLQLAVIEPCSHALLRLLHHQDVFARSACVAVVEVSGEQLQLVLLQADAVLHTCSRPLPLTHATSDLATMIASLLQFACSVTQGRCAEMVLLTGAASDTLALAAEEGCGIPCSVFTPFPAIGLAEHIEADAVSSCAAQLAVPCGLALRGFA